MASSTATEKVAKEDALDAPEPSSRSSITGAKIIVVMGVSGTGKSTLGKALARALHLAFVDADDLHPAANVAKMARGEPLEDDDRWPWLARVRARAVQSAGSGPGVVVACSALKRAYRAVLRGQGGSTEGWFTWFVFLEGTREVLEARMTRREGHFMKAGMLESQLGALERPEGESGVVTVSVATSTEEQVKRVVEGLGCA